MKKNIDFDEFFEKLPFLVNGTLSPEDQRAMHVFFSKNPELLEDLCWHQGMLSYAQEYGEALKTVPSFIAKAEANPKELAPNLIDQFKSWIETFGASKANWLFKQLQTPEFGVVRSSNTESSMECMQRFIFLPMMDDQPVAEWQQHIQAFDGRLFGPDSQSRYLIQIPESKVGQFKEVMASVAGGILQEIVSLRMMLRPDVSNLQYKALLAITGGVLSIDADQQGYTSLDVPLEQVEEIKKILTQRENEFGIEFFFG